MNNPFKNKTILITGGTGSLGRAIIQKLKKYDCKIVVYSRDEGKQALYFGQDKSIIRVIGDIRDYNQLSKTFRLHKPNYVIHTAAVNFEAPYTFIGTQALSVDTKIHLSTPPKREATATFSVP